MPRRSAQSTTRQPGMAYRRRSCGIVSSMCRDRADPAGLDITESTGAVLASDRSREARSRNQASAQEQPACFLVPNLKCSRLSRPRRAGFQKAAVASSSLKPRPPKRPVKEVVNSTYEPVHCSRSSWFTHTHMKTRGWKTDRRCPGDWEDSKPGVSSHTEPWLVTAG